MSIEWSIVSRAADRSEDKDRKLAGVRWYWIDDHVKKRV